MKSLRFLIVFAIAIPLTAFSQVPAAVQPQAQPQNQTQNQIQTLNQNQGRMPTSSDEFITNRPEFTPSSITGEDYQIGRDDMIEVTVFESAELGGIFRVTASGQVSLPLVGTITAYKRTPQELERSIEASLKKGFIHDPHVRVFVREYASQPVSILGSVRVPGIYQIKGQRSLMDMLAMAQGLDGSAGKLVQVIRKRDEVVTAEIDRVEVTLGEVAVPSGSAKNGATQLPPETIVINLEELESGTAELNIRIYPNDVINVIKASSIFIVGEVARAGEFPLKNGKDVTVIQAVGLGNGFTRDAQQKESRIIRMHRDGTREEIPVNLKKILDGSSDDVAMLPDDILFVPANKAKAAAMRALDSAIQVLTGRLIYRF